jgi:hypothetical protein
MRQLGDPSKFEINVGGVILRFDQGGTVYDLKNIPVGEMACYSSNDCGQYGYASNVPAWQRPATTTKISWNDIAEQIARGKGQGARDQSIWVRFQ